MLVVSLVLGAVAGATRPLHGQGIVASRGWQEATVGSELETYLRVLQLAGETPLYPWSIRGFSPRELDRLAPRDSLHPWADRLPAPASNAAPGLRFALLRPDARLIYNSSFAWAHTDGVVWAGRGLTGAVEGGVQARWGPLSVTLDPIVFWAQNAAFALQPNGLQGPQSFGNGISPSTIDLPQRFGAAPYSRLDAGQSSVRLDAFGLALGVSTADQIWGPGISQPLVLGNAGPGFLHFFFGSSSPVNLWIGHLHGRLEIGRLEQSPYSPMPTDSGTRLMSGIVATLVPRWTPGLELGFTRVYHQLWQGWHVGDFLIPLQSLFLTQLNSSKKYDPTSPDYTPQNQISSVFARWAFPASGFEVFGEFVRDDRSRDLRDLLNEPDHESGFMLGFMKVVRRRDGSLVVLRGELANGRVTELAQVRPQVPLYVHTPLLAGHTNLGIVLGSPLAAQGGVGSTLGVDLYRPDGRWTAELTRDSRPEPAQPGGVAGGRLDVPNALRVERLLFRQGWDFTAAATAVFELNRNFAGDAFNLRLDVGARVALNRGGGR